MGPEQTKIAPAVKRKRSRWTRWVAAGFAVVAIFYLGMLVGSGQLSPIIHRQSQVTKGLPTRLNYNSVNDVYRSLKLNYDGQLTQQQLEDGLKHGLAESTKDPYTVYFTAKEAKEFNDDLNQSFSGIGAQLGMDDDQNIQIIAPIDGLPAQKAGILAKDIVTTINGQTTSGMSVDEAVKKIRGPKGTKVKLDIVRNRSQALSFTIVREDITLPSIKTKTLDNNICYIQVTTFANDTNKLIKEAADKCKATNPKGIILDLRDNPGGLLDSAVYISGLWLPQGQKVLDEKRGGQVVQSYNSEGSAQLKGIKSVVLINGGSASASEITTGALKDNKAAYVIGEKSYGKGVVQQLINFGDGSQLKVTVASWYTPNGHNINHKGIMPDKVVKMSEADIKAGNDTQLTAAEQYINQ